MTKKNIALIEFSSCLGGSAKCVFQFASFHDKFKYNIFLFIRKKQGIYSKIANISHINIDTISLFIFPPFFTSLPKPLNYLFKIIEIIFMVPLLVFYIYKFYRYRINLVHINNNIYLHISAIVAARMLAIPVICHFHGHDALTFIEKCLIPFIDRFFVLSKAAFEHYGSYINQDKIRIIRNGIIPSKYHDRNKQSTLGVKSPSVGVVGRLVPWKGQETLIKSIPHVLMQIPNVNFYIIGEDPSGRKEYINKLHKLVESNGYQHQVNFTGWINDPSVYYQALDICVCPSIEPEPFGLVILEAMVCGTPVIASKHGGPLDIIEDGLNGFLYEPGNEIELGYIICKILQNKDLAQQVSSAGVQTVLKNYSIASIINEIDVEYCHLLR